MQSTDNRFLEFIKIHGDIRPMDLARELNISKAALHQHLKRLVKNGLVEKIGTPPKVYYQSAVGGIEEEIKKALIKNPHIISAYILGSYLSGNTDQESDFDLAVVVNKNLPGLEKDIYNSIQKIKFPKNLDLSVVDKNSSPLFLFQIISTGKRIFEKNTFEAIAFEDFSLHNYYDTAHLRHLNYLSLKEKFLYAN